MSEEMRRELSVGAELQAELIPPAVINALLTEGAVNKLSRYTSGSYKATATGSAGVIAHGLGKTPRMVIFYMTSSPYSPSYSQSVSTAFYQVLFSRTYVSANASGGSTYSANYIYIYSTRFAYYSSSTATTQSYMAKNTVSCNSNSGAVSGIPKAYCCHDFNEETFTTPSDLWVNKTYSWIAIE
ncbi:MAG: hypothetical protein IKZ30_04815 [Oscillospiraceae bacterium]|nr:hypothetical protein [Oscillospiraceae bacterium]